MISYYFNLFGVVMFAISGALAASDKNMYKYMFGVSFTAFARAVGGGALRDIILGALPIAWISDNNYFIDITEGVFLVIIVRELLVNVHKRLLVFKPFGIA